MVDERDKTQTYAHTQLKHTHTHLAGLLQLHGVRAGVMRALEVLQRTKQTRVLHHTIDTP